MLFKTEEHQYVNSADFERLNDSIDAEDAIVRSVVATDESREILTRWPNLIDPLTAIKNAAAFFSSDHQPGLLGTHQGAIDQNSHK